MDGVAARQSSVLAGPARLHRWGPYAMGLALAVVAIALEIATDRLFAGTSPLAFFYPAVLVAALYLGVGPATLTHILCTLAIIDFIHPEAGWFALQEPFDITDLGLFIGIGGAIIWLASSQRRARLHAAAAALDAQTHARILETEIVQRRKAEEALQDSNRELEDFAHIVSHDLKEPLRGLSNTAGFLLEDYGQALGPEARGRLERLVAIPKRMTTLLDALLEYSRLGRTELRLAPADLGQVAREVIEQLSPWLEQSGAEVVVLGDLPRVVCDRVRVGQVFGNLIANGVKYNRSGRKRVEISIRTGQGAPVICVCDNGIGIEPAQAGEIFKMFKRLHPKDAFGGGSGSGLAMAKKVIERHGGRIWVESRAGEGSTFCFTLGPESPLGPAA